MKDVKLHEDPGPHLCIEPSNQMHLPESSGLSQPGSFSSSNLSSGLRSADSGSRRLSQPTSSNHCSHSDISQPILSSDSKLSHLEPSPNNSESRVGHPEPLHCSESSLGHTQSSLNSDFRFSHAQNNSESRLRHPESLHGSEFRLTRPDPIQSSEIRFNFQMLVWSAKNPHVTQILILVWMILIQAQILNRVVQTHQTSIRRPNWVTLNLFIIQTQKHSILNEATMAQITDWVISIMLPPVQKPD